MTDASQGGDGRTGAVRPDPRLVARGRWLHRTVAVFLALTLALDAVLLSTMLLRLGDYAGIAGGRIEFVLPADRAYPPILDAGVSPDFRAISSFPLWQSLLAALLLAARLAPVIGVLWSLLALFGMYAKGAVFAPRNTMLVRRIAGSLAAYALVPVANAGVLVGLGMSRATFEIEMRQIDAAVMAVILFAIAHVVTFGAAIDEEREAFV